VTKKKKNKVKDEKDDYKLLTIDDDLGFMLWKLELDNEFLSYHESMLESEYLTDKEIDLLKKIKKPKQI
jgi:hypothetical protein